MFAKIEKNHGLINPSVSESIHFDAPTLDPLHNLAIMSTTISE